MSYTKIGKPNAAQLVALTAALNVALAQFGVADPVAETLAPSGVIVQLDTFQKVWVGCVAWDRPETPQIDFITAAIAIKGSAPWVKPNGQMVATVFWHGMWPDAIADLGVATIRRALMLIALGEAQPRVPIGTPAPGGPVDRDAIEMAGASARSIRPVMSATSQVSGPADDVL